MLLGRGEAVLSAWTLGAVSTICAGVEFVLLGKGEVVLSAWMFGSVPDCVLDSGIGVVPVVFPVVSLSVLFVLGSIVEFVLTGEMVVLGELSERE